MLTHPTHAIHTQFTSPFSQSVHVQPSQFSCSLRASLEELYSIKVRVYRQQQEENKQGPEEGEWMGATGLETAAA